MMDEEDKSLLVNEVKSSVKKISVVLDEISSCLAKTFILLYVITILLGIIVYKLW